MGSSIPPTMNFVVFQSIFAMKSNRLKWLTLMKFLCDNSTNSSLVKGLAMLDKILFDFALYPY